ncbi:hypothetical protein QOZ96_003602 [Brevundimonas nasdae]|uniref:hypothetical protein n=1 Tax=Brevundimonas nasdae TaxID=172043 RepID=UPI00191181D8|nr:hypothetical protein [Brevundimonas nasdae]MBK6024541.1 hypothetical protein [Brevundimonas nasdae]MDQ0453629.1 hypothetical protein [Brevundimonas nasdae]
MTEVSDDRLGIVRLHLPDGRSIPLQLTYAALDAHGYEWVMDRFKDLQKGRSGSSKAAGDLIELLSNGAVSSSEVLSAPAASYPLNATLKALWRAWEIGQYGPDGRSAEEGPANPRKSRRPTLWARLFP